MKRDQGGAQHAVATWEKKGSGWVRMDAPAAGAERSIAQEVPAQALVSSVAEVLTADGDAQDAQLRAAGAAAEARLLAVQTQASAQDTASCGTQ